MQDHVTWDDRYNLIGSPLLRYGVVTASAGYLAGVASAAAVILATGAITVTLPVAAAFPGRAFWIKNIGAAGATTIDVIDSSFIDGALTQTLPDQYDVMLVVSDGTTWHVLSFTDL